jgi:hypothetical protein
MSEPRVLATGNRPFAILALIAYFEMIVKGFQKRLLFGDTMGIG